jgi:hypothetical protein
MDDKERDFYVRQLWDGKRSVEIETLPPKGLTAPSPTPPSRAASR